MVVRSEQHSKDDRTRKILLELNDGKLIESVLMLYPPIVESSPRTKGTGRSQGSSQHVSSTRNVVAPFASARGNVSSTRNVVAPLASARATVCVSTQAGCAFGCTFCATGQ